MSRDAGEFPSLHERESVLTKMIYSVGIVARVINMLFDIDYAVSCTPLPGFVLVPLPSTKSLWDARSAKSWRTEFDLALNAREIHGVTTEGELVRLQQRLGIISTHSTKWEEWYASVGELGTLIMVAASII